DGADRLRPEFVRKLAQLTLLELPQIGGITDRVEQLPVGCLGFGLILTNANGGILQFSNSRKGFRDVSPKLPLNNREGGVAEHQAIPQAAMIFPSDCPCMTACTGNIAPFILAIVAPAPLLDVPTCTRNGG